MTIASAARSEAAPGVARRRDKRHGILGVWADHLPAARGIGADALVKLATSSVRPRIHQAATGV